MARKVHQIEDSTAITIRSPDDFASAELSVQYLGVGGFLFEHGDVRLLTAPHFSMPKLGQAASPGAITIDENEIERGFPERLKQDGYDVQAIVVGHSHYDHLMDVPYLVERYLSESDIYGSETAAAILDNFGIPCDAGADTRAIAVNGAAEQGDWLKVSEQLRILPIASSHAPHVLGLTFQTGHYTCGEQFDLESAWDWKMGNVYAYLIDFLDADGRIAWRVYYQDSANRPEAGLVPDHEIRNRGVDVAILTLAGSHNVERYPASRIDNLAAELYVVGHWEDFFGAARPPYEVSIGSSEAKFIRDLEHAIHTADNPGAKTQWFMPLPQDTVTVRY